MTEVDLDELERLADLAPWRLSSEERNAAIFALPDLIAAARERDELRREVESQAKAIDGWIHHAAERDSEIRRLRARMYAAVRRAEEAEAEVVRAHLFACWGWTSMELTGEEVRVLLADACVICRRALGKGEG